MTETVSNMSTMVDSLLCYFKADSDKLSFSSAPFKLTSIKEYLFSTSAGWPTAKVFTWT